MALSIISGHQSSHLDRHLESSISQDHDYPQTAIPPSNLLRKWEDTVTGKTTLLTVDIC
ncbi:hypothetical protein GBAR_LOCUS27991 [Geodia barretti]|uniref:Uncharacterized protein n=1 Tax=Geodia barretti TaxID=519541 RepID=A0AA35TMK2_GEOBA|nr:hypothetical protein GBAR_LOCUS27991 [Geodia barretti]